MHNTFFRKGLIAVVAVFVTSVACAQAPHGSYEVLFQSAIKAITWDFHEDWAFTVTSSDKDSDRVGRFDPRQPEDKRWTLLTLDGRAPTDEESAEYAEDSRDHHFGDGNSDDDDNAIDMVEPGTLRLIEETDDYWLLNFVPTDGDDENEDEDEDDVGRKILESMQGTVKIIKDGEYLACIDIHNEKPIRPKFGVKMKNFLMHMSFGPIAEDGPVVMRSMDFAIKLSAFVLVRVNEAESVAFSDFEYAGEALLPRSSSFDAHTTGADNLKPANQSP